MLILLVTVGATFVRGEDALDPLFGIGFLAITIGFLVAAVLDARGRATPRRAALVLLAGWIVTVALDSGLGVGAGWLAVAALAAAPARPATRSPQGHSRRGLPPNGGRGSTALPSGCPRRVRPMTPDCSEVLKASQLRKPPRPVGGASSMSAPSLTEVARTVGPVLAYANRELTSDSRPNFPDGSASRPTSGAGHRRLRADPRRLSARR